jgi:hypothetical protein
MVSLGQPRDKGQAAGFVMLFFVISVGRSLQVVLRKFVRQSFCDVFAVGLARTRCAHCGATFFQVNESTRAISGTVLG